MHRVAKRVFSLLTLFIFLGEVTLARQIKMGAVPNQLDLKDFYSNDTLSPILFSSQYFITFNGFPTKKGENFKQWNSYGPNFQFGIAENFVIGVMTTWIAAPLVVTSKYSLPIKDKINLSLNISMESGLWAYNDLGFAFLGGVTFGNVMNNFTISSGYGVLMKAGEKKERPLLSVAGRVKVNEKTSFVFDSFGIRKGPNRVVSRVDYRDRANPITHYFTETQPGFALFIIGLRWQKARDKAFQFGLMGIFNPSLVPVPIPILQWYRTL